MMFLRIYRCNIVIIIYDCYQPGSQNRIHFGYNNNHFTSIHQHKIAPDACRHILCRLIGSND